MTCRFHFPTVHISLRLSSCKGWPVTTPEGGTGTQPSQAMRPPSTQVSEEIQHGLPRELWACRREAPARFQSLGTQSGAPRSLASPHPPAPPQQGFSFQPAGHSERSELPLHTAVLPAHAPHSQPALTTPRCHGAALSACQNLGDAPALCPLPV